MQQADLRTIAACVLLAVCVASCAGQPRRDGPGTQRPPAVPGDAIPRPEPRSKYGNGPVYEVLGKRYTVMPTSAGYRERGVASWYGRKFHGNLTSNREVYDMYAMTAAHKTLPLPTYVQVRNLANGRSIVVRVNDRGPFLHNRIIDLSYAAAQKLDMVRDGTALVEVTAISFDETAGERPVRRLDPPAPPTATPAPVAEENRVYVQVGAFGDRANAERRIALLAGAGIANAFIHTETTTAGPLYRVRIGPVDGVVQYDVLVETLGNAGITDPYLITE